LSKRLVASFLLVLLIVSVLVLAFKIEPVVSEPATITVPDDYATIQEAISNANDGDTIFVKAGIYHESVAVTKSLSLIGEDKSTTIVDGNHTQSRVVYIPASHVNLTGFTIQNGGSYSCGISAGGSWVPSTGINISNNIITDSYYGLNLAVSFDSIVSNNEIFNNTVGIYYRSRIWDRNIWTMNADGSSQMQLTDATTWDDSPEWYPKDSKILFERLSSGIFVEKMPWDIWVMNSDGTDKTRLTWDAQQNQLGGWSPNCSLIVYDSYKSGNQDIWLMNSEGTENRQLTSDPATDTMPTWSPDGTKIAFISEDRKSTRLNSSHTT